MATDQDKESNHYEDQDCSPESLIKHPLQVLVSERHITREKFLTLPACLGGRAVPVLVPA
jgi:hypothetical protein